MDWLSSLPNVGWATAISLGVALAIYLINARHDALKERTNRVLQAEQDYRDAVASRDPDRIALAAQRLRDAQRHARQA